MEKRKRAVLALLLILSIANYARLGTHETIRMIDLLSILVMGALAGILLVDVMRMLKGK